MFFSLPTLNPILLASAILPAAVLLVKIYRADRLDKEPTKLLLTLVFAGIIATALAVITERIGAFLVGLIFPESSVAYQFFLYFFVVAVSEEGFKYLLLRQRTWKSPQFNCQFDAVVYATFVSLGFALWENISYVASFGFGTALVRAVTAIPGHACFGVFMGVFYGAAKKYDFQGKAAESKKYRVLSLLIPILLHGTYDFVASLGSSGASLIFVAFVAAMFFLSYGLVKKMSRTDQYIDNQTHTEDLWNF